MNWIGQTSFPDLEPWLTPERRLVLGFISGLDPHDPALSQIDWEKVYQLVASQRLVGLAHEALSNFDAAESIPLWFREQIGQDARLAALRMALKYRHIRRLLQGLNQSGLDYLVVKGPALAWGFYNQPLHRQFNDLDLVVHESGWRQAHQALTALNCTQREGLPAPPPKLGPQVVMKHTSYLHAGSQFLVELHYDDLLNAGLAARHCDGFWSRSQELTIDGMSVRTLSLDDTLLHSGAHAFFHHFHRLNWLADLALILAKRGREIDWSRYLHTVKAEEAQTAAYYSLLYTQRLAGAAVPPEVLQALEPDAFRRWAYQALVPPREIAMGRWREAPYFSFYFVPFWRRLLPDLAVMGRRREKYQTLLRLLWPPRDWLVYYYHLQSSYGVALHYLLHPLHLLWGVLSEGFTLLWGVFLKRAHRSAPPRKVGAEPPNMNRALKESAPRVK